MLCNSHVARTTTIDRRAYQLATSTIMSRQRGRQRHPFEQRQPLRSRRPLHHRF